MASRHRRAIVAAAVATLGVLVGVAGAGHAYLREWRRAVGWFALVIGSSMLLTLAFVDVSTLDPTTVGLADLPPEVKLPVLALLLLSTLDAYRVANPGIRSGDEDGGVPCPNCGRALDDDLHFCPWCAGPLEPDATDN